MVTLQDVKNALGITGIYQDDTLQVYVDEVIAFLVDAGVPESNITNGIVARGVSDLWNYGGGDGKLSQYFMQRAIQLTKFKPSTNSGGGGKTKLIEKTITANGQYNPADDNADGYSIVTVNVPTGAKYSDGLSFYDYIGEGKSLAVTGIGECTDTDIVVPPTAESIYSDYDLIVNYIYSGLDTPNITSIVLPSSIAYIEEKGSCGGANTESITLRGKTPPILTDVSAFMKVPETCRWFVPAESLNAYKTATNWAAIADRIFPIQE